MRSLPLVQTLIASPCDVPWTSMTGDDRTRHCGSCDRHVHNLSAMTGDELADFLKALEPVAEAGGPLPCVGVYQRSDGTVLTADCPVGISLRRRRALLTTTLSVGAVALAAFTALATMLAPVDDDAERAARRDEPTQSPLSPVFWSADKKAYPPPDPPIFDPVTRPSPPMLAGLMAAPIPTNVPAPVPPDPTTRALPRNASSKRALPGKDPTHNRRPAGHARRPKRDEFGDGVNEASHSGLGDDSL